MADGQVTKPLKADHPRKAARRGTLKSARIAFNLGRSTLDVRIENLSENGARLKMSIPWPFPARFGLEILNTTSGSPGVRRCALKWQRGDSCGVEFV